MSRIEGVLKVDILRGRKVKHRKILITSLSRVLNLYEKLLQNILIGIRLCIHDDGAYSINIWQLIVLFIHLSFPPEFKTTTILPRHQFLCTMALWWWAVLLWWIGRPNKSIGRCHCVCTYLHTRSDQPIFSC